MTYKWETLIDRCLVYTDASRKALHMFLKEAEVEMTRKVNILEDSVSWDTKEDVKILTISNFKEVKSLYVKGDRMSMMTEDELLLDTTNTKHQGTPTKFYIQTTSSAVSPVYKVILNLKPSTTMAFKMHYWSLATSASTGPIIPGQFQTDLCYYAIAQVSAKTNPELYQTNLSLWAQSIMSIQNESADRDLIYNIKEEI